MIFPATQQIGTYETLMAKVVLYAGNILHVRVKIDDKLTLDVVKVHNEVSEKFHLEKGVKQVDVIFDLRDVSLFRVPNEVMRYWASPNAHTHFVRRMALVLDNRLHQQMANFYIRIFRPINLTRFFTNEHLALNWLQQP